MFDFTFTQGSLSLSVYCFILFMLLILTSFSTCTKIHIARNYSLRKRQFFLVGVAIFSVTCFINGDFYHYSEMVHNYDFLDIKANHGEPVYGYIINFLHNNYFMFRIVVWGGATYLLSKTIQQLGLDDYKIIFYLFTSYILTFAYARASLAFGFYYYGIALICSSKKSNWQIIKGLLLLICSYYFHYSMVVVIALTPIIFLPFNWKTIGLTFLFIPLFFSIFKDVISSALIDNIFFENEDLSNLFVQHAQREFAEVNWKGQIYEWSNYLTYFIPLIVLTYCGYFKKKINFPFYIAALFKISFALTILAVMFLFLDIEGKVFFYRVLFMTFIPLSILVYYYAEHRIIKRKTFMYLILIGLAAQLYRFFYSIYLYI